MSDEVSPHVYTNHTSVMLRDVVEDDLPIFYKHQLDQDASSMAAFQSRNRADFNAHWIKIMADQTNTKRTILYCGNVAGYIVRYMQFNLYEVGYWLGKEYWGKGIATIALKRFLEIVPDRPLYAHVAKHNIASQRVLLKSGFTIHSDNQAPFSSMGSEVDELMFVLLPEHQ